MKINKLISTNRWDMIYKLLKQKKLIGDEKFFNNNVIHIIALNNQIKLLEHVAKHNPDTLKIFNYEGNSTYHILAINGYADTLRNIINIVDDQSIFYLLNDKNETVYDILYNNYSFIKWIIHNFNTITFDNIDENGYTVTLKNIFDTKNENDNNFKILKILIKHGVDLNHSTNISPLNLSLMLKKEYVATILLDNGSSVNQFDSIYMTPLLYAIKNNMNGIVHRLLKYKDIDLNYVGPEGEFNPMIMAIDSTNDYIINLLIERGFDVNKFNKYMQTPLHIALKNNELKPSTVANLIHHTNLNIQNINGETSLHSIIKFDKWRYYNKIIESKMIDIFVRDKNNMTPIDYINDKDMNDFLQIVTNNYINHIDSSLINKIYGDRNHCNQDYYSDRCLQILKNYIFKTRNSIPRKSDINAIKTEFSVNNTPVSGRFNSDTLHNMIYLIEILKKYKNVGIPFQYYIYDKYVTDKLQQTINDCYRDDYENVIVDLVKIYTDYFYEILPYIIIWRSETQYYIHKDLKFYLQKCLNSTKIRFVIIKLTLVIGTSGTHANIIIYDKHTKILERFEPYGIIPYLSADKLDDFIYENLKNIFDISEYLTPTKMYNNIGFQTISNDSNIMVKKLGDPIGYCLAWTLWYLELRVQNPDIHPKDLIVKTMSEIINNKSHTSEKSRLFIDFIRSYSNDLDILKNKFLKRSGINRKNYYNVILSNNDQQDIVHLLINDLNKIIAERY